MWNQLKKIAQVQKEFWQMTKAEFIDFLKAKKEKFDVAKIAVQPIGWFMAFPNEKIIHTTSRGYTYINKKGNAYDFDLITTQADLGRKRVVAKYFGIDTIAAGLIVNEDGQIVNIYTEEPGIGLAQAIIKEANNTIGDIKLPEDTISKSGAKVAHRYYVEKALNEGRDVPKEVLNEYPDLKGKYNVEST